MTPIIVYTPHLHRYAETPLIVIALDGFRHDYLQKYKKELPNIRRLSKSLLVQLFSVLP